KRPPSDTFGQTKSLAIRSSTLIALHRQTAANASSSQPIAGSAPAPEAGNPWEAELQPTTRSRLSKSGSTPKESAKARPLSPAKSSSITKPRRPLSIITPRRLRYSRTSSASRGGFAQKVRERPPAAYGGRPPL